MSVNLVTLGMFYSLAVFAFVPDGSVLSALLLSGIVMTFLCVTYAGLIAVMPRAGGDYVWQTRILDGVPGTLLGAIVGGVDGLPCRPGASGSRRRRGIARWRAWCRRRWRARLEARRDRLRPVRHRLVVHPRAVGADLRLHPEDRGRPAPGRPDGLDRTARPSSSSNNGTFAVSLFTIIIASGAVALGMAGYARVQRWCIWIGLILLAGDVPADARVLVRTPSMRRSTARPSSLFGVKDAYNADDRQRRPPTTASWPAARRSTSG